MVGASSSSVAEPAVVDVEDMRRKASEAAANAAAGEGAVHAKEGAKHGLLEFKAYVMDNPPSLKVTAFVTGVCLIIFSVLMLINPTIFGELNFTPAHYLTNLYNIGFGVIIIICDGKESWMKCCCNVQVRLFYQCFFLATVTGRALFYIYVGIGSLLVPHNWFLSIFNGLIGGTLLFLGFAYIGIYWLGGFCGCDRDFSYITDRSSSSSDLKVPEPDMVPEPVLQVD